MKKFMTVMISAVVLGNFAVLPNVSADDSSAIILENSAYPKWCMAEENSFIFMGKISSEKTLAKVSAEIFRRNGDEAVQFVETAVDSKVFDIAETLNSALKVSALERGAYTFVLSAEDTDGYSVQLVNSDFLKMGSREDYSGLLMGDINGDGKVDSDDA